VLNGFARRIVGQPQGSFDKIMSDRVSLPLIRTMRLQLFVHIVSSLGLQNILVQEGPVTQQKPYLPPLLQSMFSNLRQLVDISKGFKDDEDSLRIFGELQALTLHTCNVSTLKTSNRVWGQVA